MGNRGLLGLSLALILVGGSAVTTRAARTETTKQEAQSTAQHDAKPALHQITGTVDSVTPAEVVLDHQWKGKDEKTTFTLNSGTKKEGSVERGSRATVLYHVENKERVATDVKVLGAKSMTEGKKS